MAIVVLYFNLTYFISSPIPSLYMEILPVFKVLGQEEPSLESYL